MVKNLTGGNKSKRFASKNTSNVSGKVRKSMCEDEVYAVVDKMCGGNICIVKIKKSDDSYHCVIRGKFRGRNKSSNIIKPGSWVLVGMRDWESSSRNKCCDLLEVYNPNDIDVLKQVENRDILPLDHDDDDDDLFDRRIVSEEGDVADDEPVDETDYTFDGISFDDI